MTVACLIDVLVLECMPDCGIDTIDVADFAGVCVADE